MKSDLHPRTREILASLGGDARRWPADERATLLATIAADAGLRAERRDALALDALLDEWAGRDVAGGDAHAAAARVLRPARTWRHLAGGGLAAGIAALVVAGAPLLRPAAPAAVPVAATAPLSDEAAFASVFNPTPDEESII